MSLNDQQSGPAYAFGPFLLNPKERLLSRDDQQVPLPPKAFETLVVLVQRSGHLVEKGELMKLLWPNSFVEEANLNHQIWTVRKALSAWQDGDCIETVPKRGFRFTVPVRELLPAAESLVIEKHSFTRVVTEEQQTSTSHDIDQLSVGGRPTLWRRPLKASVVVGVLCLVGGGSFVMRDRFWPAHQSAIIAPNGAKPLLTSIAVLPFKTIGTGNDNEYLGLGMSDALITKLGNVHRIAVRPTSAVRKYVDSTQDPIAIGKQQGVDTVLDGSVQKIDDRFRVTVQLFRVSDGASLWSGQFDERLTDLFSLQDSISQQVTQGLLVRLSDDETKRLQNHTSVVPEAYQAYIKGRYFWNKRSEEGFEKAVEYFNQAIAIDPTYAQAYAGLADSYQFLSAFDTAKRLDHYSKSRAAAQRALELDSTLAEPHASLGLIAMNYDWDWATCEREHRRAIELNPNYATAHHWYAEYLVAVGRLDEALVEIKRARELDPLSLILNTDIGKVFYLSRNYEQAIAQLRKTLEMDPEFNQARIWLGLSYEEKGLHDEALSEFRKAKESDDQYWAIAFMGYVYGRQGQLGAAQDVLTELKKLSMHKAIDPISISVVYIGMGDKDQAFVWLEKEYAVRSVGLTSLKVHPIFDSLRSDPRFADLIGRVGLNR